MYTCSLLCTAGAHAVTKDYLHADTSMLRLGTWIAGHAGGSAPDHLERILFVEGTCRCAVTQPDNWQPQSGISIYALLQHLECQDTKPANRCSAAINCTGEGCRTPCLAGTQHLANLRAWLASPSSRAGFTIALQKPCH